MRKFISTLAACSVVFSLMVQPVSGQGVASLFDDVDEVHDSFEAIQYLKDNGIVEGYGDGTYRPAAEINRAEFIKIATLMVADQSEVDDCINADQKAAGTVFFADVPADSWYGPYVCVAKRRGLVQGYDDGTFRPGRNISFVESSKIVLKVFGYDTNENGEKWYTNYAQRMELLKAIPYDIEGPHTPINRADMAEIVWRIDTNVVDKLSQTLAQLEAPGLPIPPSGGEDVPTEPFPALASCLDLTDRIAAATQNDVYFEGGLGGGGVVPLAAPSSDSSAKEETSGDAAPGGGDGDGDYSRTNVQVEGVDEGDIVKNDGNYIYYVRYDTVRILKANPVENMVELSKLSFKDSSFYPSEIYLSGDKLVVIGNTWMARAYSTDGRELLPYEYNQSRTKIFVVDVSDRSNPKKLREVSIQGDYSSSRRIDGYVYLAMNTNPGYWGGPIPVDGEDLIPRISDSAVGVNGEMGVEQPVVGCTDIHYFPGYVRPNYLIVAGVPLNDLDQAVESEVMLGASENIYSSFKNLYVASTDYNYGVGRPIPLIMDSAEGNAVDEIAPEPEDSETTVVYKFGLDNGKVDFKATGKVPGRILNQFSMDENGDNFRIATTKGNFWDDVNLATNNVYVLDNGMQVVGKIEGIAPGEQIYSTRFIGDRLYMVTFKNTDPLFVIDMKEPTNPKILGKLKIPGYSDYLHPYDENHIIGFGKEAVEAKAEDGGREGFAWYQGMKMAIFDVSNVEEPKQQFVEIIGDRGTDSDLLWNHKALLFEKDKNLLAFPITVAELTQEQKDSGDQWQYGSTVFQGAYVYNIDLVDGFKLRGKISHYDDEDVYTKSGDYFYGEQGLNIKRVLRIGNYLYSVSDNLVKASGLNDVLEANRVRMSD